MPDPQEIVERLTTKADKIRALDRAGYTRSEIAEFLGIRYQHVRNTLIQATGAAPGARSTSAASAPPRTVELWPMQSLLAAGFELIAECALSGDEAFGYSAKAPQGAGVYAFAVDGWIKYVGLTRNGLRTRLGHYVYGHSAQRTSAHVKGLILDALRAGHRVEVLVTSPPALEWNGLPVDGAAGLETGLIRLIKPEWNRQGNR